MKFINAIIPDKFLPTAMRSDSKAVKNFSKDLALKKKRVTASLTHRRQFLATMQQDELKLAIEMAEMPECPRRDYLYDIYRVALRDGHLYGEAAKAINKVVGSPYGIFKKGSKEINELATRLLMKDWFEEYRCYHEEARLWGHSLIQFLDMVESNEEGVKFEFKCIDLIPREHVRPEEGFIVIDTSHETGIPFRDPVIAKQLRLIEIGKPKNLGTMLIVSKEVIWKNYSRSDWSRTSEKFGQPMVVLKLNTTDTKEIDKAEEQAKNFGNNLWMIVDPEDEVDLKEPTFKDSYKIYKEKALFCNDEMSKALTWQTGTSDEKAYVGSAEVHERVLNDYVEAAKRKQTYHINDTLIPFLIEHGYPLKDCEFRYLSYDEANPEAAAQKEAQQNKSGGGASGKKDQRPSSEDLLK